MTIFLSILAFLIIFSLLILIHEFGHFFTAKKAGVKVLEFGMGLPPRIWGFKPKKSETMYSINAIPFGGFVRLYGEDFTDAKAQKSKRSFVNKSLLSKSAIVCAGVFMNFLLAWVLLTIGFAIGIQPLLMTANDVTNAIDQGIVNIDEGIKLSSLNDKNAQNLIGSYVTAIDDRPVGITNSFSDLKDGQKVKLTLNSPEGKRSLDLIWDENNPPVNVNEIILVPRIEIFDVSDSSPFAGLGLSRGDVVLKIDGRSVFSPEDFEFNIRSKNRADFVLIHDGLKSTVAYDPSLGGVVVTDLVKDAEAENSGLLIGDLISEINGVSVYDSISAVEALKMRKGDQHVLTIIRNGNTTNLYVGVDENGLSGFYMSELSTYRGVTYYAKTVASSLGSINNVQYPLYIAPLKAIEEMGRLTVLTFGVLGQVVRQIFTEFSVPEGVAGPVGIAQMTFIFVQEGLMSLIRFTALLSLSLALINILPIPGLDGGRLLLIWISALFGKKMNIKIEAWLNLIGFLFLMLILFLVTFNDLMRLFS